MISIEDKYFKKAVICVFIFLVIILGIQYLFINKYLVGMQRNNLRVYESVIGRLKNDYNLDDAKLRDAVLGDIEKENIETGQAILSKFGYKDTMDLGDNKLFFSDSKNLYAIIISSTVLILILFASISIYYIKKVRYQLDDISDDIGNLIYKKGYIKRDDSGFGAMANLNSRINELEKIMKKRLQDVSEDRKKLKELINDLSHQIKTPIASLKLSNSFLQDEDLTEEESKEFIETSTEDIDRLEWLSEGLIQISRLETGIVNLNIKPHKLEDTLTDAINAVYSKAMDKGVKLEIENIDRVIIGHDYRWTKEAIINILDNAIKYTGNSGKVNISLEDDNALVKIIIKDTGMGIPHNEIYNVFKRFYRGNNIEIERQEGSGLGLYISRRIIEGQKGTISLESEEGKGSSFTLIFYKKLI